MTPRYSIYIHIPFCRHRCAYCDFNTYARQEVAIPAYVDALVREIEYVAKGFSSPHGRGDRGEGDVHTIFFGGGTPSLLAPSQFASILDAISKNFTLVDPEITVEANPGTVSLSTLRELRRLGVNRISFGVQSANPEELRMLEREHTYFDVINAVTWARTAGFDNLNLDLIYGLPHQNPDTWSATLKLTLGLAPEHLSLYSLTMEHGTPFGRWSARGLMPVPDPDLAAGMYEYAGETLAATGYEQYEISNWAKPGRECRHNLQYWRGLPYLGLGAGAHGYANGYRYSNALRIKTYIERLGTDPSECFKPSDGLTFPLTPAAVNHHRQTPRDDMGEFMMTVLRLTREGVSGEIFRERFGMDMREVFGKEIDELIRVGLLEYSDSPLPEGEGTGVKVRLTRRGRLLGNRVFMRFIG